MLGGGSSGPSFSNQGRFSGSVKMVSSSAFSFVDEAETLTRSSQDSLEGSFVSVSSNASADSKLVTYDVQNIADNNDASNDGRRAVSAGAQYNLSVHSDENSRFLPVYRQQKSVQDNCRLSAFNSIDCQP